MVYLEFSYNLIYMRQNYRNLKVQNIIVYSVVELEKH